MLPNILSFLYDTSVFLFLLPIHDQCGFFFFTLDMRSDHQTMGTTSANACFGYNSQVGSLVLI